MTDTSLTVTPSVAPTAGWRGALVSIGLACAWIIAALAAGAVTLIVCQRFPLFPDASANAIFTNAATLVASAVVFGLSGLARGFRTPFRIVGPTPSAAVLIAIGLGAAAYAMMMSHVSSSGLPKLDPAVLRQHAFLFALQAIAMCLLVPIGEEMLFRGWLWQRLAPHVGTMATGVVTTAVWVLVHAPTGWFTVLTLIPIGIAIAVARHRSAGLLAPLAIHVLYNASAQASHLATLFFIR